METKLKLRTALKATAAVAALTIGCGVAQAAPIAVTFDPGVVVTGASQFTADTLNLKDFARVDLTGNNFTENGYLQFNNASLADNTFNPTGNRSTYSLYLQFSATGTQSLPNFNGSSTGVINSLAYTLYGVAGGSTFGIDGSNNPFVNNNGNSPTALATGSLIQGTTTFSTNPLGAGANVSATFVQQLAGFIVSPANATLTLGAAFNNNPNIINVLNNGQTFTLNGGGGDLSFTSTAVPTPEPASLGLLGAGLAAVGLVSVRRRKAG